MATSLSYPIHTIAEVTTQIEQGEDPWEPTRTAYTLTNADPVFTTMWKVVSHPLKTSAQTSA